MNSKYFVGSIQDYTRQHMISQILAMSIPSRTLRERLEGMSWDELRSEWRAMLDSTIPRVETN